jgi:uncharacterized membrane protein
VRVSVRVAAGGPTSPRSVRSRGDLEIDFSRVAAFSDGVFAIAITLLVLGLQIPSGLSDLGQQLRDRGDEFFAYGLSFAVIGSLWIDHHRFFTGLRGVDGRLMSLNLVYLAFIALVPFSSSVLGSYAGQSAAVIVYALNIIAISIAFTLMMVHSFRSDLMTEAAKHERGGELANESVVIPAVFALSIPVALVIPQQTPYVWLLIPLLLRALRPGSFSRAR